MMPPRSFHSRYAPEREAERFVEASLHQKNPGAILVLGPGENHISDVLRRRYPWASIYSIHPSNDFGHEATTNHLQWWPHAPTDLRTFLKKALFNEQTAAGVAVLEWEPVMTAYPEMATVIRNEVARALASAAADRATVTYWAKSWLKNCLNFAQRIQSTALYQNSTHPLFLVAAGPSLNDHLDFIYARKHRVSIWALASAVPALLERNIQPEAVVSTDPGYWSGVHLRFARQNRIPVFMPPSAYCGTGILETGVPVIPLDTGLIFETEILNALKVQSTSALPFGTSAGTALSLALQLHTGPIFIFGLDLAARGIKTHVQPYAFDILGESKASRLKPWQSQRYAECVDVYPEHDGVWRFSRAFSAYANELSIADNQKNRVYRISDSTVSAGGLIKCRLEQVPSLDQVQKTGTLIARTGLHVQNSNAAEAMLSRLENIAQSGLTRIQETAQAFSFDEALILKALCGSSAAPILSMAARGKPEPDLLARTGENLAAAIVEWKQKWR